MEVLYFAIADIVDRWGTWFAWKGRLFEIRVQNCEQVGNVQLLT